MITQHELKTITKAQHETYLDTCFIAVTDRGLGIYSRGVNGDSEPMPQVYRFELPMGAVGDEMWERLSTGLRLRNLQ